MGNGQDPEVQSRAKAERRKLSEELILRVAEEVFAEKGYSGATITEIAQRAGLPKTNIHYYFSNKKNLYQRVIEEVFTDWLHAADQFTDLDNPQTVLEGYINAKMDLARSRPNGSKIWANEIIHNAPMIKGYLESELTAWVATRERCIQEWINSGKLRAVEPKFLLYLIWASTQHYADFGAQIEVLNGGVPLSDEQFEKAKKTLCSVILNGLLL